MKLVDKLETAPKVPEHLILWDINAVKAAVGWKSNSAVYTNIRESGFPEPLRVGMRASKWRKAEVLDWLENLEHANVGKRTEVEQ